MLCVSASLRLCGDPRPYSSSVIRHSFFASPRLCGDRPPAPAPEVAQGGEDGHRGDRGEIGAPEEQHGGAQAEAFEERAARQQAQRDRRPGDRREQAEDAPAQRRWHPLLLQRIDQGVDRPGGQPAEEAREEEERQRGKGREHQEGERADGERQEEEGTARQARPQRA